MSRKNRRKTYQIEGNAIIIDSNLLLLLLIGTFDRRSITSFHQRLSKYTIWDYDYLLDLVKGKKIIITPNILTEISNLSLKFDRRLEFFNFLKSYFPSLNERYIPSADASASDTFIKFGLTDAAIVELSKQGIVTLTDDLPLYGYLVTQNYYAVNFSQLRTQYLIKH